MEANRSARRAWSGSFRRWIAEAGRIVSSLLAILASVSATADQTFWCRSLGVEQGLSQNFITALAQDQDGVLWFGTLDGLNRWDGYEFQPYPHVFDDPTSLGAAVVLALHVDRAGNLWVGTTKGLDRFDQGANAFRHCAFPGFGPGKYGAITVEGIASDRAGRIWCASFADHRLFRLDPRTGQASEHFVAGMAKQLVTALLVDDADRLWVAMQAAENDPAPEDRGYRLWVWDQASQLAGAELSAGRQPVRLDEAGGKIITLLEDRSQRVWFGRNGGGLVRFDPRSGAADRVTVDPHDPAALAHGVVRSLALGPAGEIWALTRTSDPKANEPLERLHRVDAETRAVQRKDLRERVIRPGDDARWERLAVDHSGVLWVGSNAGGLRYADVTLGGFTLYRKELPGVPGLKSGFIRSICRTHDGSVWVGTPSGLNLIRRSGSEVRYSCTAPDVPRELQQARIQALHESRQGLLYIGTDLGLAVFEPRTGALRQFRHDLADRRSLGWDWVQSVLEAPDGRIWIGTFGEGVDEFDPETGVFTHHPPRDDDLSTPPRGSVNALLLDRARRLWVGTSAGLAKLEAPLGTDRRFERVATETAALGGVCVQSIAESPATPGALWIGTEERGLCRLDVKQGSCRFYTVRNSHLPDDTIYGILVDGVGRLWMSTNRGLVRFDPRAETFQTYVAEMGLQSNEFNALAYHQAADGEMFFGGVGGLNAFFPEQVTDNPLPPKVLVTQVRVLDLEAASPETASTLVHRHGMPPAVVKIGYRQRDVSFDFVGLHYSNAARNRCLYKLDHYDADWQGPVAQRRVRYTNLDPGSYTFRVRAVSSHGVSSAGEATFSFVILPPFYATPGFRVLAALGIVGALAGSYRWRVRRLHRQRDRLEGQIAERTTELRRALEIVEGQARKLQELDAAKSRFFANISHEFRTPLSLTLGPLRDVNAGLHGPLPADAREQIDLAIHNAERQSRLVDDLLLLARLDARQLELQPRDLALAEFLRMAAAPFEALARRQGTRLELDLTASPMYARIDPLKFEQVIRNLLGNALKFTPAGGQVTLRLIAGPAGWAIIQVDDTGPGIPPADLSRVFERFYRGAAYEGQPPGAGIGLALARELVDLHGGEIRAENRDGGGARFTVGLRTVPPPSAEAAVAGTTEASVPAGRAASSSAVAPSPRTVAPLPSSGHPLPAWRGEGRERGAGPGSGVQFAKLCVGTFSPPTDGGEGREEEGPDRRDPLSLLPKLLVIEDHADMRAYLRKHLASQFQVIEASRGDEGWQAARTELPDLVVSDVMMPGMDGDALCRALKSDPETDFIPVILVTARAGAEGRIEGLESGADDYIAKPFEPAELVVRIRNLLASRARLRARYRAAPATAPALPQAESPTASSPVDPFVQRVQGILERKSPADTFDVGALAAELALSRAQMHRRIVEGFGKTPAEIIIEYRLERAAGLLRQRAGNVGEIAYAVGFKNLSHFVKRFRERYGQTPAAYAAAAAGKTAPGAG